MNGISTVPSEFHMHMVEERISIAFYMKQSENVLCKNSHKLCFVSFRYILFRFNGTPLYSRSHSHFDSWNFKVRCKCWKWTNSTWSIKKTWTQLARMCTCEHCTFCTMECKKTRKQLIRGRGIRLLLLFFSSELKHCQRINLFSVFLLLLLLQ